MSTKTLRKRIALVAVSALAVTGLSTVPANAVAQTGVALTAMNAKAATANDYVAGTAQTIYFGGTSGGVDDFENTETLIVRAAPTSYPAGGFVGLTGQTGGGTLVFTGTAATDAGSGNSVTLTSGADQTAAGTVTATGTDGLGSFTITPTIAGAYTVTVWNDADDDGQIDVTEAQVNVNLTIVAAADLVVSASTAWLTGTAAGQAAAASSSTNAIPRSGVKTAGTYIAQVSIDLKKSDGTDDDRAHTITAVVSGQGYVAANTTADTDPNVTTRVATDSSAQSERYVHIEADGTAGSGSVTVTVTHAVTGVTSTLGTWSWTTYGDVTKIEVSTKNFTIGRAGYTTGAPDGNLAARTAAGNAKPALDAAGTVPAFIIKMTDSGGRPANRGALPTFTTSNAAVITGGTCAVDDGSAVATGDSSSTNGVGFYNCNFDTAATAKSGDKATLTLSVVDPADATKSLTTTIELTVGGSVATETISFDKASYEPGEGMTLTITGKDSSGNPVYDGAASPAITFSKSVGGTAPAAANYVGGKKSSTGSSGVKTVFAPSIGGTFSANATSGNSAGSAITATATVASPADAQIAALVAAIAKLQAAINKINKRLKR